MQRGPWGPILLVVILVAGCLSPQNPVSAPFDLTSRPAALISGLLYPALAIEIDHTEGLSPDPRVLESLVDTLYQVTSKQDIRITSVEASVEPTIGHTWSLAELDALHQATFESGPADAFGANGTAYLHILFVDGKYSWESALGITPSHSIVIFLEQIRGKQTVPTGAVMLDPLERHIVIHETGHALGLVNSEIPMVRPHEDPDSLHHSSNPRSVMTNERFVVGTDDPRDLPRHGTELPFTFDEDDLADLRQADRMIALALERNSS